MFKLVRGKVDEIEARLNAACAEGYTQVFREFPIFDASTGLPLGELAFLMKKPDDPSGQVAGYVDVFRDMMTSLGLGDRLPPKQKPATVLDLVRPQGEAQEAPTPASE
jgi:hypothetical protein